MAQPPLWLRERALRRAGPHDGPRATILDLAVDLGHPNFVPDMTAYLRARGDLALLGLLRRYWPLVVWTLRATGDEEDSTDA